MKKLFFTLLTLCLCGATWAQTITVDGLTYNILSSSLGSMTVEVASNTSATGDITIPVTVTDPSTVDVAYTVVSVSARAFEGDTNLTSVTFEDAEENPSQLTEIGTEAFYACSNLASITLPESLTTLSSYALGATALESVVIPMGVTKLDDRLFAYCSSLKTVTFNGAATLGDYVFRDCTSLEAIILLGEPGETGGMEGSNDFYDDYNNITLYVPTGSATTYLSSNWADDVVGYTYLSWNFFSTNVSANGYDGENTYYATYYVDEEGYFLYGGTAYYVPSIENGEIVTEAIDGIIPVNTAILIGSSAAGDYYFYKEYESTNTEATITSNMLYGSNEAVETTVNGVTDGYYFYKLSRNAAGDSGSVGFYWNNEDGSAFTCPAYKAYLAVPQTEVTGLNHISFKKDEGDTTGISAVESLSEKAISGIYTIQGVRVSNMNQPGLYIVDGKKVLVK